MAINSGVPLTGLPGMKDSLTRIVNQQATIENNASCFYSDVENAIELGASLALFSNAYKEDVVFPLLPTDGSGDLTFTRASTATRVNSDGLIETSPVNLATNSENYTLWNLANVTVTANDITAPNGTLTADKLTISSNGNDVKQTISVMPNSVYTWTFYVYGGTALGQQMRFYDNTNSANIEYYDYSSYVVLGAWVKIERTFTTPSGCYEIQAWVLAATSTIGTMWVWGAQLNIGSTAKPYFPTTDRLNVPRIDYTGGGCGKLLLEPQRTNLVTYSEQFDNAAWTKLNLTVSANSVTSPDGTQNADTITDNTTNGVHVTYQIPSGQSVGTAWTCYMKKGSLNYGYISAVQSTTFFTTAIINLTNGAIVEVQNGSTTTGTVTAEDCGNGWYRVKMQTNANGAGYAIGTANGAALSGTYKEAIYTGTGSGTIYIWGAQLEDSTYPTSYIPTLASSVTRLADSAIKDSITSLIGQTEGTIFADIVRTTSTANDTFWVNISDGSTNNWFFMGTEATAGRFYVRVGNSVKVDEYPAFSVGRHKLALAYKSGQIAGYMDGVQLFTSTATFTLTSLTRISLGPSSASSNVINTPAQVNEVVLFPTRLTNAELASLTTL